MSAKLVFNSELPKPTIVSEEIHSLLEACGYQVVEQEIFKLVYEKTESDGFNRKLSFDMSDFSYSRFWPVAEDDRKPHWATCFKGEFQSLVKDEDIALMLHTLQAINLATVPEFRQMMREVMANTISHPSKAVA